MSKQFRIVKRNYPDGYDRYCVQCLDSLLPNNWAEVRTYTTLTEAIFEAELSVAAASDGEVVWP